MVRGYDVQLPFFPCSLLTLTALFFVPVCTILISKCLSFVLRNRELIVDSALEPVKTAARRGTVKEPLR